MKVKILVFDGCEELDALAPYEVLKSATSIAKADFEIELATLHGQTEITAAHGLRLRVDTALSLEEKLDILVVPGGGWAKVDASVGTRAEVRRGEIPDAIATLHRSGTLIAGVCTGAMLIAAAGLLKSRPGITHAIALKDLAAQGTEIIRARVVDDGDIITSAGVTSGLELALWLIERYAGSHVAHRVETYLEYERRGTVWRRQ
ncbi:DJ-1/PfpI family protein [Castellaniella sp. S9]|uniref:DJ-1/PfpI family protein n=1 Tax=Castellaniella sp. S9 TaxID=2993652 RepID=UPI0022B45814|nr:DJ-1/PfpI family protein [Castellaniella sp. S9]